MRTNFRFNRKSVPIYYKSFIVSILNSDIFIFFVPRHKRYCSVQHQQKTNLPNTSQQIDFFRNPTKQKIPDPKAEDRFASRRTRRIRRTCRTMITHAEIVEIAEAYRTKLRRIAIHKILRVLRAKNYSTTTFRVTPPNFTKYMPCGNSMVVFPSISRLRKVCPKVLVMVIVPEPSTIKRSFAGFG